MGHCKKFYAPAFGGPFTKLLTITVNILVNRRGVKADPGF